MVEVLGVGTAVVEQAEAEQVFDFIDNLFAGSFVDIAPMENEVFDLSLLRFGRLLFLQPLNNIKFLLCDCLWVFLSFLRAAGSDKGNSGGCSEWYDHI